MKNRIAFVDYIRVVACLLFTCITSAPRWITSIAQLTFGMYLMHLFFLPFVSEWIIGGDIKVLSLIPGSKYVIG
ncbi:hypothetical protein [Prevotella sp. P2-180]|uniref:hypothetical protein n=1 Tax=Prevotella sp. P2-180 TaxID=2024224 RepID=UPI000B97A811|nr:hypothetical protein [Prevotella sp. P2-180]OYP64097.1 hypothetical protein CIK98_10955 [Prevotella sp. P2-180]